MTNEQQYDFISNVDNQVRFDRWCMEKYGFDTWYGRPVGEPKLPRELEFMDKLRELLDIYEEVEDIDLRKFFIPTAKVVSEIYHESRSL